MRMSLIVVLCLFATLLAPPAVHAQGAVPCSWPLETSVDSRLNVAYPDTNAVYWTMPIDTSLWRGMVVTGRFPATRFASFTSYDTKGAAIEGLLCGLADGLDAVRRTGVVAERILLIGGAAQNPAVSAIAAQVFDCPVVVPNSGEYVALGAAVQAAWTLTGTRPAWEIPLVAAPAPDYHPVIREQYAAHLS